MTSVLPVQVPPSPTGQPTSVSIISTNSASPSFTCKAYREQKPRWDYCIDQLGGTDYIRAKGELYLPKMEAEQPNDYLARLKRSDYYAMFEETCQGLAGMVMRRPITLEEDAPQELIDLGEDVDGLGTGLNIWAGHFLFDSLARGHMGLLVDFPEVDETATRDQTYTIKPYFCAIAPENILNWQTTMENGRVVLTRLTIREIHILPDEMFGEKEVVRYRVYRRALVEGKGQVTVELWEGDFSGKFVSRIKEPRIVRPVTLIPFAVHYSGQRIGYLFSKPPLLELAYTNVAHYQVNSDYRNSLHISSCPIFVTKGLRRRAGGNQAVGATIGLEVGKEGDAKYVEHTGAALGSAREAIQDIEARAAALGLSMLKRETRTAETLGAVKLDKSEQVSKLARAAKNLEDVLEVAYKFAAEFMGVTYEDAEVIVNQDFSDLTFDPDMIRALNELVAGGNLSRMTLWELLVRGGILPDSFDPKEEDKRLNEQGDNAGLIGQIKDAAQARGLPGMTPGGKPDLKMLAGGGKPPIAPIKPVPKVGAK